MTTTDVQVRKLMAEYQKLGSVSTAALPAGMHRNTASKYLKAGKLPRKVQKPGRTLMQPRGGSSPGVLRRVGAAGPRRPGSVVAVHPAETAKISI